MSKNEYIYPERYEIKEVCDNFIKRRYLNQMMQELGIFCVNASTTEISQVLSNCIFDAVTIENLRNNASQSSNRNCLSGFQIKTDLADFSIKEIYEKARDDSSINTSKQYSLGILIKENRNGIDYFKGTLNYEIKKPGRIQFMDSEKGTCDFYMYEKNKNEWQVEVDGTRSSDGKEVQKMFNQLIGNKQAQIHVLDIDRLKDKETIEFFDEIIKKGLPHEWIFQDVVALTFRRGRDDEEEDESENVEVSEETNNRSTALSGIRQAILEGGNLRDNQFVQQFEENGCIFTAMTIEYRNSSTPETIHIRAEFKGNPKIFEVSIVNVYENKGPNAIKEPSSLPIKKNLELRTLFWNKSRDIYTKIVSRDQSKIR